MEQIAWRVRFSGGGLLAGLSIVLGGFFPGPSALRAASWQASLEGEGVPRVAVGEITGSPGASLMIPLYFTPDPNVALRSLSVEIDYVSNSLKFSKASPGVAAEQAGAVLKATLTEGTPDDKNVTRSKLRVDVSLGEAQPKEGIPEGLLAYLMFDVSLEAKPFVIRLNTTVLSAEDSQNPPQKVASVKAVSGTVAVELMDDMPATMCFFFSH